MKGTPWTQPEIETLQINYGKVPMSRLPEHLPQRTKHAINAMAQKLRLPSNRPAMIAITKRRYSRNQNFFSVPSPLVSYWAGFIAADGCIYKGQSSKSIVFNLQERDGHHLQCLADAIGYNGPIRYSRKEAHFAIHSVNKMADDLMRHYSITQHKSFTLQPPPNLDVANSLAFIAGYIDGDGSIRVAHPIADGHQYTTPMISVCGTHDFLVWVASAFDSIAPRANRRVSAPRRNNHHNSIYDYTISATRAIQVANRIVALDLPLLQRKWSCLATYC